MGEDDVADRGRSFDAMYEGTPPWDIGRAQPAFVELEAAGAIVGDVLDVGCGTGENALVLAERGHDVVGVDTAAGAIERARAKARQRSVDVEFLVHDAYDLAALGRRFDTIVDSGLFHVLVRDDPEAFAASLRAVLRPGGRLYVLAFDDRDEGQGPAVSPREVRDAFADGWTVESIDESVFETVGVEGHKRRAWLATIAAAAPPSDAPNR